MTARAELDRLAMIKALAPPFGLFIVAMGGAKLNRDAESATQLAMDPVVVILGGLLEVTLGLLVFFRPTRFPAAVACSVWLAGLSGYLLMNGSEGPVPL